MEEDIKVSEEFKKWFNKGYDLRNKMPEVVKSMKLSENEQSENMKAFAAGAKEFEREYGFDKDQERDRLREAFKQNEKSQDRGMDLGR